MTSSNIIKKKILTFGFYNRTVKTNSSDSSKFIFVVCSIYSHHLLRLFTWIKTLFAKQAAECKQRQDSDMNVYSCTSSPIKHSLDPEPWYQSGPLSQHLKSASWVNIIQVPNPFGQDAGRGAMEGIGEDEWIVSKDKVFYKT